MKMYIDGKLPKDCFECPCFRPDDTESSCGLDENYEGYFKDEIDGGKCPLHTTQALKKQLKKEVVEDIKQKLAEKDPGSLQTIGSILDQI